MKGISLVSRTLAELKKHSMTYQVVEHYNMYDRKRHDLFGMFDVLAIYDKRIIGIQVCSRGTLKAHLKKIMDNPVRQIWLVALGKIEIWAWHKVCKLNKDGKKSKVKEWQVVIQEIKED